MVELKQITNFKNIYSENLFPTSSVINQDTVITNTEGDASYTLNDFSFYKGNRSIKYFYNSNTDSGDTSVFNLGDSLKVTTQQDGRYIFSFCLANYVNDLDYTVGVKVNVFVDSLLVETIEGDVNFLASEYLKYKTFSQSLPLNFSSMSDINFSIELSVPVAPTAIYPNYEFFIDAFKFELDNRFLGIPTPYSLPVDYFISSQGTDSNKVTGNIEMEAGVVATLPQHLVTKSFVETPENQTQTQISEAITGTDSVTNNGRNTVFIHDAALTPTLTINLPSAPVNNQIVTLVSVLGITTLTLATFLGTIVGGVTSLVAGVSVRYIWKSSKNKWYKI
jgi:hypothetical protein